MSSWILQHFLNPSFFIPGMALIAAPIIIHLINRLRYKRVRFAAMDFLLASQKRNQRRILIEQLLLLLLRILLILAIVALIARMIIDPSRLSLFQGSKSHHIVVLDDTLSMQERTTQGTVFDRAKEVVRRLVSEGADSTQSQVFTLVLMSDPGTSLSGLSEVDLNSNLLVDLTERLDVIRCTHQAADPGTALEMVLERLSGDRAAARYVHVISDFRSLNWIENKSAISNLKALEAAEFRVNLVRCLEENSENLTLSELGGKVEVAAAGVPVTLTGTVRNYGSRSAEDVKASIYIDGTKILNTVDFQTISAGEESTRRFDVEFETAEFHHVELRLLDDALEADNRRFLAVDVPEDNPVLIVDGSPGTEQAIYIADALAADQSVTGFATSIQTPDDLRRTPLENYDLIYLINVPELAPDAVAALEDYVSKGGGLVWYLGDAVRPSFYNETLFDPNETLFPIRIGLAPEPLSRADESSLSQPDLIPAEIPLFELFSNADVPILDLVYIRLAYPPETRSSSQPTMAKDVRILAELRDGRPLFLENHYGKGTIITCLTSAGPLTNPEGIVWTNWANGPASFSFAVFQLELAKHLVRSDRSVPQLLSGEPIQFKLNQAYYQPDIEVNAPNDQMSRIQSSTMLPGADSDDASAEEEIPQLDVSYTQTDSPGIYQFTLMTQENSNENRLFAVNVLPEEGDLRIMDDEKLRSELGFESTIEIHQAGSFDWIRNESLGSEIRWLLLVAIALLCIGEQYLASRLSYVS